MMRKILLVLLPIVLLALVWLLAVGGAEHVSAQGLIEYSSRVAVEYELLLFGPVGWRSEIKNGCVVYKSTKLPGDGTSMLIVYLTKDLWEYLAPGQEPTPFYFQFAADAVVTVCGDTVHLRWVPLDSGG